MIIRSAKVVRKDSSNLENQGSRAKQAKESPREGVAVYVEQILVLVGVFARSFIAGDVEFVLDSSLVALRLSTILTHERRERKVGEIRMFLREIGQLEARKLVEVPSGELSAA
jgi:hypothetical protein